MDPHVKELLSGVFARYSALKLVYFFGSRATGNEGPMSDYDFGVYFDGLSKVEMFNVEMELAASIGRVLNTDAVDIVNLTSCEMPELKYDIVAKGERVYTIEPFHIIVEP